MGSEAVQVRSVGERDRDEWLLLRQALWPDREPARHEAEVAEILKRRFHKAAFVCVQETEGGVIGFAEVSRRPFAEGCEDGPVGYLEGVYVRPEFRGHGAGRRLLGAVERWARDQGCREIACHVSLGDGAVERWPERIGLSEAARLAVYRKSIVPRARPAEAAPGEQELEALWGPATQTPVELVDGGRAASPTRRVAKIAIHAIVLLLGVIAMYHTDIWSDDPFYGIVLPLVDVVFVLYVVALIIIYAYGRRGPQREPSAEELFQRTVDESD